MELKTYLTLSEKDSLLGRIPNLYNFDRTKRVLDLELIRGQSLRHALEELSFDRLDSIKQSIRETLQIIHESDICHGDISLDNIHFPAVLLDFSHAHIRSKHSRQWKALKQRDLDNLEEVFHMARKLKVYESQRL